MKIKFVVGPGLELLDLAGPMSVFHSTLAYHGGPYHLDVVSAEGGSISSCQGLAIETRAPLEGDPPDTVIAVGGPEPRAGGDPATAGLLASLAPGARRIAGVCTGAFLLAEAGLLDGHRATTHWRFAASLQSRFPKVRVEADRIFIADRSIWTSAGITAGIDMALALVEEDCGAEVARAVARDLLVYYRRPGGQSQFSAIADLEPRSSRIRRALAYAREHLGEELTVPRLAEVACISPRQFARLFAQETGETPARAVERLRAEIARPRLEEGSEPIEVVARGAGFGDAERMRRAFLRLYGQSPQALRRIARNHESLKTNHLRDR